ncbi:hypothetical protein KFE25_014385 [Diacronema lutheri]|uniref:Uncharacterized protein n=2 Tax=Diacronema lutheri TaxID=2081491 RepID=A0A8J5XAM1_DIALT|nr:hypothetical protein KFE25_014385 [Diacronema lutheri]
MPKQIVDDFPVWPGDQVCKPRAGTIMFDAYNTSPDGLPPKMLSKNAVLNACTQICLPAGVKGAAEGHGVRYGGSCFGENDSMVNPTYADGSPIPDHTLVCPGPVFELEGSVAGVQYFTYKCTEGDVIDYGAPYK